MKDYKDRIEKLITEASECELIGNLAIEQTKRATFLRLAQQFRTIADQLRAEMDGETGLPSDSEREFLLRNAKDFRDLAATCKDEAVSRELLRMAVEFEQKAEDE